MSEESPILAALKAAGIEGDNAIQIGMELGNAVARLQRSRGTEFDEALKKSLISDFGTSGVTAENVDSLVAAVHAEHEARTPIVRGKAGGWNQSR